MKGCEMEGEGERSIGPKWNLYEKFQLTLTPSQEYQLWWKSIKLFDLWNVSSLYRFGFLKAVFRELAKYVTCSGSTGSQMGQGWH
jgi:hypothetical protein